MEYTPQQLVAMIHLIENSTPTRPEEEKAKEILLEDLKQQYKDLMFDLNNTLS